MKRLRELRVASGKTVEECAESVGIRVRRFYRFESLDSEPTWDIAIKIAETLGVTLDELAGRSKSAA